MYIMSQSVTIGCNANIASYFFQTPDLPRPPCRTKEIWMALFLCGWSDVCRMQRFSRKLGKVGNVGKKGKVENFGKVWKVGNVGKAGKVKK